MVCGFVLLPDLVLASCDWGGLDAGLRTRLRTFFRSARTLHESATFQNLLTQMSPSLQGLFGATVISLFDCVAGLQEIPHVSAQG